MEAASEVWLSLGRSGCELRLCDDSWGPQSQVHALLTPRLAQEVALNMSLLLGWRQDCPGQEEMDTESPEVICWRGGNLKKDSFPLKHIKCKQMPLLFKLDIQHTELWSKSLHTHLVFPVVCCIDDWRWQKQHRRQTWSDSLRWSSSMSCSTSHWLNVKKKKLWIRE